MSTFNTSIDPTKSPRGDTFPTDKEKADLTAKRKLNLEGPEHTHSDFQRNRMARIAKEAGALSPEENQAQLDALAAEAKDVAARIPKPNGLSDEEWAGMLADGQRLNHFTGAHPANKGFAAHVAEKARTVKSSKAVGPADISPDGAKASKTGRGIAG